MITIKIISTPTALEKMSANRGQIIERLQRRMELVMLKLQSKIVGETIPEMFPNGAPRIASAVGQSKQPTEISGTTIVGALQLGGGAGGMSLTGITTSGRGTVVETLGGPRAGQTVDFAILQHEGTAGPYVIQPVAFSSAMAISQKARVKSEVGLPLALKLVIDGQVVYRKRVTHPGLKPRPYMTAALNAMAEQITAEFQAEVNSFFTE